MGILNQIDKGEGKTLEFKEILPTSEPLAKSIVAFANTAGGRILIGVKNNKIVCGVDQRLLPDYMDRISNMLHDSIYPLVMPDIYSYAINDLNIIVVEVYQSSLRPHFLKKLGKEAGTYIRVGATNKQAGQEYIQELERQRLNISYDEDFCLEYANEQPIIQEVQELLSAQLNKHVSTEQLFNLKLLKNQQAQVRLTNAAPILLGKPEHVAIKCARFKGNDSAIFLDRKEFSGNLLAQLEETMKFLLSHIHLNGKIGSDYLRRVDTYEIPPVALREAVVNAIVHRDYVMSGSDIKVAVYDSKIEITSPGSLPKGISIDEILNGRSEIRNKVIARVFKEAELIEQWGRGIQQMHQLCVENGLRRPDIIETGMFVQVRFYRQEVTQTVLREEKARMETGRKQKKPDDNKKNRTKTGRKPDENRTKTGRKSDENRTNKKPDFQLQQQTVLEYLRAHDTITAAIARQVLELGKSRTANILEAMIADGMIVKVGQGRSTCYRTH